MRTRVHVRQTRSNGKMSPLPLRLRLALPLAQSAKAVFGGLVATTNKQWPRTP